MGTTETKKYIYFKIKPFKDNEREIGYWEKIIESLISLKEKTISFAISGNRQEIDFYVKLPISFKNYFENIFYTSYPTSDLEEQDSLKISKEKVWIALDKRGVFKEKKDFEKEGKYLDPMCGLLSIYEKIDRSIKLDLFFDYTFEIEKGAVAKAFEVIGKFLKWMRTPAKKKETNEENKEQEEKKKQIYFAFSYVITSSDPVMKQGIEREIASVISTFIKEGNYTLSKIEKWNYCSFSEVINFFHIPTQENFIKGLDYTLYRKLPFPSNLPSEEVDYGEQKITILGDTDYRGDKIRFGIKEEDKFRHVYIVGKTGTGKSTFISNMIISDINAGNGICVLDPHGELVDTIVESIPSHRINDVILFDISDTEYPIGFNLLQAENEDEKNRIASGVVSTFQKLFDNSRGPRLEYILRNVVLSVIDYPNATLMHILRVLTDKDFREEVVSHIKDSVILKFRNNEFNKWQDKQREEAVGPITNKIGQFLSSRLVRNVFGQPRSRLSMRKAMDEGKIILVNLSKGKIGEDNANMIGSLLVTKIQIDAMARADTAAHLRRPFYLYIDEFQNFATKSFATILSEARKYKLSLIVANQYTSQLDEEIKNAIFGNVGSIVSFTLGHDDALVIKSQFKDLVSSNDLISLPKYTAYTRLMIDGISSDPFSMKTLPPYEPQGGDEYIEKIRAQSRQRYAMEREQLEALMNARNTKSFSPQEKIKEKSEYLAYGLTEQESETLQEIEVKKRLVHFGECVIAGEEADAMVFEPEHNAIKYVRYQAPEILSQEAQILHRVGEKIEISEGKFLDFTIDSYQHTAITVNNTPAIIRVGEKEQIKQQLFNMCQGLNISDRANSPFKYIVNIDKIKNKTTLAKVQAQQQAQKFSVKDIKLGETYEGYVKLIYNYGMFVTYKGVEGLLHKNFIAPLENGVDWKKYYNIGDKITIKAQEFKEINGEQRIVRSQI